MKPLTDQDRTRIAEAVARAERGTSGEIRCVLVPATHDTRASALWAAALLAMGLFPALTLAGLELARFWAKDDWSMGGAAASEITLGIYVLAQAAAFAVIWLLGSWTDLRRVLTPGDVLTARVNLAAVAQFEALGLTATRDRTGILLFVSLADHRAQVLADSGIYEKADHAVWDEVVGLLVAGLKAGDPASGFVSAVDRTGQTLAGCLPPREDDANELSDHLVER